MRQFARPSRATRRREQRRSREYRPRICKKAARAFGSAERGSIVYAMGITQHIVGTDNVQALANLVLATGNIGREGTGLYPLRGHQNVQGACDMGALPDLYCGYQKVAPARQKFEQAWGTAAS